MQYKAAELVTDEDLKALFGAVAESTRLEYKEQLPGRSDDEKAEFLKDVSALANTDGGDILFGVAQDRASGTASHFELVDNNLLDAEIARLSQVLQTGVRPRVPDVQMRPIQIESGKSVLLVRVPQSRIGPHQITFRQSYKFYGRTSNGTYIIEVDELRDKILRQASLAEQMRAFRHDRIELIRHHPEDMPHALGYERKLVMHFIPEETFSRYNAVDVSEILVSGPKLQSIVLYNPTESGLGMNYRPNLDGALYMNGRTTAPFGFYVQVFNDASIEFVDAVAFFNPSNEAILYPSTVEYDMFAGYDVAVRVFRALGVQGRFYVLATAIGIRDLQMRLPSRLPTTLSLINGDVTIKRDPAFFNEVVVEGMDTPASVALYPLVAQLWRACGYTKPYSYDDEGNYRGRAFYD